MISYRPAALEDAADIHALLLRLAPEIPLLVDTLEREEALYTLVRSCARSGESWVATDDDDRIVGCALAETNQRGRHYAENEMIELRYAGVAPDTQNAGALTELVSRIIRRAVPVTATVSPQNRTGLLALLTGLGFRLAGDAGGEQRLRWEPGRT